MCASVCIVVHLKLLPNHYLVVSSVDNAIKMKSIFFEHEYVFDDDGNWNACNSLSSKFTFCIHTHKSLMLHAKRAHLKSIMNVCFWVTFHTTIQTQNQFNRLLLLLGFLLLLLFLYDTLKKIWTFGHLKKRRYSKLTIKLHKFKPHLAHILNASIDITRHFVFSCYSAKVPLWNFKH